MKTVYVKILKPILLSGLIALSLSACKKADVSGDPQKSATSSQSDTGNSFENNMTQYKDAVQQWIGAGNSVGLAISIVDHDNQDFILAGLARAETQDKIKPEHLFEIGSITKTFTAIMLADMVIKGELSLDDPAQKFLPDGVTMPGFDGKIITLENLATHTSSLPRMPGNFAPKDPLNPFADYTPELMYAFLSDHKLSRPIGERIEYSNLGLGLLGHLLERHSGLSYEELVTRRILEPLGMSNTFMMVPARKMPDFATGHDAAAEPTPHWDIPTLAGAGVLRSDINDMTIYLKANLGLMKTDLGDAIRLSHKFRHAESPDNYIGLAWFTQDMSDKKVTWHNGGTGGFRSFLGFDPKNQRGVVVLANAQADSDLIGRAILTQNPDLLKPNEPDPSLTFTAEQLDRFVGDYQLTPGFIISVTRKDKKLFAQATGQGKFPVFAKSEREFFYKVVEASLIFNEDDQGNITSLTLNQGGLMQPAIKQ